MKNENNTQHTPGPWELNRSSTGHFIKSEETDICHIEGVSPRATANAQLIAATPELLTSLKSMIKVLRAGISNHAEQYEFDNAPVVKAARQAIAKAEGKTLGVS